MAFGILHGCNVFIVSTSVLIMIRIVIIARQLVHQSIARL